MAKKRKHDSKSFDESAEPPQKQQKQDQELQELDQQQHLEDQDNMKEVEEEECEDVEEEDEKDDNQTEASSQEEDVDDKPIPMLLEPFEENQLITGQDQKLQELNQQQHLENQDNMKEVDEEEYEEVEDDGYYNQTEASSQEEDGNDDPIRMLLEPFGKNQLITLLREAADNHPDIADRIRSMANNGSAHRNIFVHGLGWDTTTETLIENFKQYGDIQDCKAVTDKISGISKGYGFILFQSRSGARKALKQPHKKIGNGMITCSLATPPVGAAPVPHVSATTAQQQSLEYTQRKIYISNVAADLDPKKLLGFFSKFGKIEEGPLGLDKATGKPKGFCLFVYRTVESARKALMEPHKNFEGHILHCRKAIDGPKSAKSQHHHNTHDHWMTTTAALNTTLGQTRTALLALSSLGAGLGLSPALGQALLGRLGTTPATAMQGGYGSEANAMGGYGTQGGLQEAISTAMQGGYSSQANLMDGYGTQGGLAAYLTAMQDGYGSQGNVMGGYGIKGRLQAAYPTAMQGGYGSQANLMGGYGIKGRLQAAYPTAMQGGYGSQANLMGGYGIKGGLQAAYPTAMQGGYGSQANLTGSYGTEGGLEAAFPNQQQGGEGNAGRGPPGLGQ